jgi:hypothetical protein
VTSAPTLALIPAPGPRLPAFPKASLHRCCHAGLVPLSDRPAVPFDPAAAFTEAARLVSADVYAATTLRAPLTIHFDDDVEMFLYTFSGHTFGPLIATSEPAAVVFLADLVQVDVIERFGNPGPSVPVTVTAPGPCSDWDNRPGSARRQMICWRKSVALPPCSPQVLRGQIPPDIQRSRLNRAL